MIALVLVIGLSFAAVPAQELPASVLDWAVAVRDTRLFESLEPYAPILGRAEKGSYFPALQILVDQYGVKWVQVGLEGGRTAYTSDAVILRHTEPDLRQLLQRADLADIGLWDDLSIERIQNRGVEIGMTRTQVLFAKGSPLREREVDSLAEWIYRRLVVLFEDGKVIALTRQQRLRNDRLISLRLSFGDAEFQQVSGSWERESKAGTAFMRCAGQGGSRFSTTVPLDGVYRFSARWPADAGNSARVMYALSQGAEQVGTFRANQRLHDRRWIDLGEANLDAGLPVVLDISSEDGQPFVVEAVAIEFLNPVAAGHVD